MSLNKNYNNKVYENYTIDGKKEKILIIECQNCLEPKIELFKNSNCTSCFFKTLYYNRNKKFSTISLRPFDRRIKFSQISKFLEFYKKLKKLKNLYYKVKNFREGCPYNEFKCKHLSNITNMDEIFFFDVIIFYTTILKRFNFFNKEDINDIKCQQCYDSNKENIEQILEIMNKLEIIKDYKNTQSIQENFLNSIDFYKSFFNIIPILNHNIQKKNTKNLGKKIENYDIGKNNLFSILIYDLIDEYEKLYEIKLFCDFKINETFFQKVIQDISINLQTIKLQKITSLTKLIKLYKNNALKILNFKYKMVSEKEKIQIALFTAIKKINIEKIFPFLIDDYVEEIFLDSPDDNIYLNHQKYGRCLTNISLTHKEIERLKTFLRLYSGQRLDYTNPSIKYVIKNQYFNCRFAIDVDPIHINKFGLDIRKLNKNILTIQDLLKKKTLSPLMAAFLYFSILYRINITVIGETDSGKTTLINALDLITPKDFRKVYVEDVVESINQIEFGKHQLRYIVDSSDNSDRLNKYTKSNQIKTLLHRSPDILYLGEILTREEAEAMFHCLAAGLRGFQTIHSKTNLSLINRLINFFKIAPSCLEDLDLIVLMSKNNYHRKISTISEIKSNNICDGNQFDNIFKFNPKEMIWIQELSLYNTSIIKKIRTNEDLDEDNFNLYLKVFKDIFAYLSNADRFDTDTLVSFFHKISYFSLKSIKDLRLFWNKWRIR